MKKEMLINVLQPEECRIAIVEDGVLEELYVERTSHESYTGNIYKGKIVNLEPAIQAAFVDFSVGRNGFLHVSDVEPQYFQRHQAAEAEAAGPSSTSTTAPGSNREPRRDRDRDREPNRRGRTEDRDPGSSSGSSRTEDRYRDRERPELSEKGRRDRSEPRSFGEGLADDDIFTPRSSSSSSSARSTPPERVDPRRGRPEPPLPSWSDEVTHARAPEHAPRGFEPDEPRSRTSRAAEPFDPDLPPSRTQRSRQAPPPSRPADPEIVDSGRGRIVDAELSPETQAPRDSRRSRGRGRPERPAPEPEPLFEAEVEPASEPVFEDIPETPRRRGGRAAIRSRGGEREPIGERPREAAPERSRPPVVERSPEIEVERPRERLREPERIREPERGREPERIREPERAREPERFRESERVREPERGREPERTRESERAREPERVREPERTRAPERARGPEVEAPRERKAHGRAGEPGYVPRRERSRTPESTFGSDIPPASLEWGELVAEPELDIDEIEGEGGPEELGPESGKLDGPRRRRRRRGRRRDREQPEGTGTPVASPRPAFGPDVDDEDELEVDEPLEREAARHGRVEDEEHLAIDDFDFGDEHIGPDDEHADEFLEDHAPVAVDEEIDPELEEEIRREIAEIAELEREMGLRGPVEARPRRGDGEPDTGRGGRFTRGRGLVKPPIQEVFRRGDEVLVQVIKESIGTKGPTLSTYISIPGRYLVLMPGLNRVGVSRKIADETQRRKLREIMTELNPPKGLGFIVRTAGLERTKRELARDLAYLLRLWKVILRRIKKAKTPAPIYQESDMITRTIRDIFTSEIDTIWIDEPAAFERAQEFLKVVMPRFVNRLKLYDEKVPLFHKYGIEDEIAKIQRRTVPLPEGGSIVIDQTEALVAIDVNSGNFRVENDAEKTAYEMNLRAAKEIARQLRLRDLGGVIVNDFIDMRDERHRRGVEKALRDAIKRDRARTKVLRMSAFGLIEMTRQRIRPSLKRSVYEDCSNCTGAGVVKTVESMSIDVMRLLALASHRDDIRRVSVGVSQAVATYLNNRKRREITRIETEANMTIQIRTEPDAAAEHLQLECYDGNNSEIRLFPPPAPTHRGRH